MRLRSLFLAALAAALVLAPFAWAAAGPVPAGRGVDRSPGAVVAAQLSTITGVAISPLLGTSALGAYQWFTARNDAARAGLPWYAQPRFWVPALIVVALVAVKDASGVALPPGLKKPFDALEVVENKFSGLIAAGAVVPYAADTLWRMLLQQSGPTAHVGATGLAMLPVFAVNWRPALDLLTIPFAIAIFLVVWMASHAINVLILLSPWGGVDAALKAARTALLGLLALVTMINPWIGALLSVVVIVIAYFVAGWSFRLTVFGTILSWDFFTRRRRRFRPAENGNALFSSAALPAVPVRTYGRLGRLEDGRLEFSFRPWLVLKPRTILVDVPAAELNVGRGLIFSTIASSCGTHFLLPPRYRGHEEELVRCYAFSGVRPAGLRKAWGSLRELVAGRGAVAAAAG